MKKIFVIAEIGINHNGSLSIAKKLIDNAKKAGFDAVKFQKRDINVVYTQSFLDGYRESPWGKTQREQKEGLEFGRLELDIARSKKLSIGQTLPEVEALLGMPHEKILGNNGTNQEEQLWIYFMDKRSLQLSFQNFLL